MKQMKITIEMVEPKDALAAEKEARKNKKVSSLKDLRNIFEEEDESLSHGEQQFGALPDEDEDEEGEELTSRVEGIQKTTPDDLALAEDPEKRIKNSKNPTIVGKKMK